jgi:hypothetical protein
MRDNYDFDKMNSIKNPYLKRLNMTMEIDHKTAEAIFEMDSICFGEGLGPNTAEYYNLMSSLKKNFPDLAKRYSWVR